MGKRTTGRKRGIERGVGKKKIRKFQADGAEEDGRGKFKSGDTTFLGIPHSKYAKWAHQLCELVVVGCERMRLIPMRRLGNGSFAPLVHWKDRLMHYAWLAFYIALTIHKTCITIRLILRDGMTTELLMCVSVLHVLLIPLAALPGVELRARETMDFLNGLPSLLPSLRKLDAGQLVAEVEELRELHAFDDISAALKCIAFFASTLGCALVASIFGIAFPSMPTLWLSSFEAWGMMPQEVLSWLPRLVWQVIFLPLEFATYFPPILVGFFIASPIIIAVGTQRIYTEEIKRVKIGDLESRRKVEYLYVCLEVFLRVYLAWLRFILVPITMGLTPAIITGTYVAIRCTDLPLFIYLIFPYVAAAFMFTLFWITHDVVRITRNSEEILSRLCSYESEHLLRMTVAERTRVIKRAKAMRPLQYPIGDFAEVNYNFPMGIWDESLNQVLFLLSF